MNVGSVLFYLAEKTLKGYILTVKFKPIVDS